MRRYAGVVAASIDDPKVRRVAEDFDLAIKDIVAGMSRLDAGYRLGGGTEPLTPSVPRAPTATRGMAPIAGVPDATDDGQGLFLRGDGAWADALYGSLTVSDTVQAAQLYATGNITTDSKVVIESGEIDADLLTATRQYQLPDAGGVFVLDAPSDGKYYARKDGAWVEIVP
jgi:hypothetical protein